jgi:endonuclease-8
MPEGPEIHYAADQLAAALAGELLVDVRFKDPALQRRRRVLRGKRVLAVQARGKAMLTAVDGGWTLYSHNHLLGFWRIVDDVDALTSEAQPRVLLVTARGAAALYAAPSVSLWKTDALDTQPYLAKLGPDVLDPAVDAAALVAHMQAPAFARRALAVLLLDQAFAAGMGNYLRSEVLYQAKLSPHRTAGDLAAGERRRLANALLDVPRRSYRAKHRAQVPPDKDYLEHTKAIFKLRVFEREGLPCPRCDGTVVNERIAARRLYWCPGCQH